MPKDKTEQDVNSEQNMQRYLRVIYSSDEIAHVNLSDEEKDILLRKALEEARRDSLTLLYNQRAINFLVDRELEEQKRESAVLFIDLDNFKKINDEYGHMVGDNVLRKVAECLKSSVKNDGMAGRIGGDEFLIFFFADGQDIPQKSAGVCERLQESLKSVFPECGLTCSIGIALYPEDGNSYEMLVEKADRALYQAKEHGKNCFAFYEE